MPTRPPMMGDSHFYDDSTYLTTLSKYSTLKYCPCKIPYIYFYFSTYFFKINKFRKIANFLKFVKVNTFGYGCQITI